MHQFKPEFYMESEILAFKCYKSEGAKEWSGGQNRWAYDRRVVEGIRSELDWNCEIVVVVAKDEEKEESHIQERERGVRVNGVR